MSKRAARAAARKARAAARGIDPRPALVALEAMLAAGPDGPVAGYAAIGDELDPAPLWPRLGGRLLCLPVVLARDAPLVFRQWQPGAPLRPGRYGISEPADGPDVTPTCLIVPCLAFDLRGGRLGYGGGYYDRTLAGLRARGRVLAIGLAYAAQEQPALPIEPTDARLDGIATETGGHWVTAPALAACPPRS